MGAAARFSSRTFAVLWAGVALSAAFPFALGAALALLAMSALQQGRRPHLRRARLSHAAREPARVPAARADPRRQLARTPAAARDASIVVAAARACSSSLLRRVFPGGGQFPFSVADFVPGVAFAVLGILVTARVPRARRLLGLFAVFLAAILVAFAIPSDLGSNVERLKFAAIPIALLAAALAAPKRIVLAVALVGVAGFWNISALAHTAKSATADPAHTTAYWAPAIRYLHAHLSPSYRVEAVDTEGALGGGVPAGRGHPDRARLVSPERLPAERAALRQDTRRARVRGVAAAPGRSLRRCSPTRTPDYSALNEATLIRSGKTSLVPVFRSAHIIVYEVPHATPLITGAGDASVLWLYPTHIVALVDEPGRYKVRVRWSPYWRASTGLRVARARRDASPARAARRARRSARVGERHARPRDADRADAAAHLRQVKRRLPCAPMIEDGKSLADQLSELGAQLDWVREYL